MLPISTVLASREVLQIELWLGAETRRSADSDAPIAEIWSSNGNIPWYISHDGWNSGADWYTVTSSGAPGTPVGLFGKLLG
jgi:hypothetical protein